MQTPKFLLKMAVLAFFTILAVSCENPLEDRVDDLEAEQARQQEVIDSLLTLVQEQNIQINALLLKNQQILDSLTSLGGEMDDMIAEQQRYIDSLYAYQQKMIEEFMATVVNTQFTSVEVFSGTCPTKWTDIDLSEVTGKNKSLVILKVERLTSASDKLVFRPNGETADWLSDSPNYYGGTTSALSVIDLEFAEAGLAMVYTDDDGLIEFRITNSRTLEASITVMFYLNNN